MVPMSTGTVVVAEIKSDNLTFNSSWDRDLWLCCSTDDAIIGEMWYGYDAGSNKDFTRTYSSVYKHQARVYNGNGYHDSSISDKFHYANMRVTHSLVTGSRKHEYAIILYNAETDVEYYFQEQ